MPATSSIALAVRQSSVDSAVNGVKNSIGGWNGCMSKAYCKWPVIVGIIIGALIVLSVLFCCVRCLCCGMECCCGCLSCCNACCPSPRNRRQKIPNDDGYRPPYNSTNPNAIPYQSQPPPVYHSPPAAASRPPAPQYAQFDASTNKGAYGKASNPDALPSMPSWENAESKKVEYYEDPADNVEMNNLDQNGHHTPGTAGTQQGLLAGGAAAGGLRPGTHSPYGSAVSAADERASCVSSDYSQGQQYPPANDLSGYGGAATGGYRGAAPLPQQQHRSPYGTPTHNSPVRQDFAGYGQQQPQHQGGYAPYSPQSSSVNVGAGYPGQKTYQTNNGPRSPLAKSDYSGTTAVEPSSQYPASYRPAQEIRDPDQYVQGYEGDAGRKPVNGSWRDI